MFLILINDVWDKQIHNNYFKLNPFLPNLNLIFNIYLIIFTLL